MADDVISRASHEVASRTFYWSRKGVHLLMKVGLCQVVGYITALVTGVDGRYVLGIVDCLHMRFIITSASYRLQAVQAYKVVVAFPLGRRLY